MQQVILNINSKTLEQKLFELSRKNNKSIDKIILDVLDYFLYNLDYNTRTELKYTTLDANKYITKINYDIDNSIDLSKVHPFSDIKDSAEYVRDNRKNAWRR